jgi:hypothetical protein
MIRTITSLIALIAVVLATMGCRSMTGRSFGEQVNDKMTTGTVKTKLVAMRGQNLGQVGVDTYHGVVYLTGTVPDKNVSTYAQETASRVTGVRQVVNNLWVREPGTPEAKAPQPGSGVASASPVTEPRGRAVVAQGEVATVDRDRNRVTLKTGDGTYDVDLPASAIATLHEGERVELLVRPIR